MVPADWVGVWVDTLPSGPVAQAAWVDGDTLHVGSHTVPITGRGISASSGLVIHAATRTGWFASLTTPHGERFGVIHPDGTVVEFQKYGKDGPGDGPLLVSPDGSQALLGSFLIDTATGRILMREPAGIGALAWGNDGIYAGTDSHGGPVMWKPGIGITKSSFDAHGCHSSYTGAGPIRANLLAGYSGCTVPRLASMSPDGTHALVTGEQKFGITFSSYVVDLRTGRRILLVPQKQLEGPDPLFRPYWTSPSYQVLWEDNEHALIELGTPTEPATAAPGKRVQDSSVIVRCNVETGSCERASDPFSASEFGLAPLTVSNPLGTSHRTPDSQIQPTGNTQHPSSSSSPSATYPTQFAGLPAVGAPVSLPANGTLVLNISPGTGGDWHVYADGRIIWQRWSRDHAPLVIPNGADPLHTSYVQQRLTPVGVQLLTSRILAIGGAVGLFRHNVSLVDPTGGPYSDWYQACNNGHLIYSQVIPPDTAAVATETSAQKRALAQVDTLLADSTSLLPASAWADRTIRPYVPSHYELLWDRADPDPSKLPSPAREALAKVLLGLNSQGTITTEQAQTLLAAFLQSRVKIDHNRANDAGLVFNIPGKDVNFSIGLEIRPALPSSALSDANGC